MEQLCDRWQVPVQTGDLLRILDAAERSLKQVEVAAQALPEKGEYGLSEAGSQLRACLGGFE